MTRKHDPEVEMVLDRFAETMFRLMLDHHQRQAVEMAMTLPQAQALRLLLGGPRSTGDLTRMDLRPGECREQAEGVRGGWIPGEKAAGHGGSVRRSLMIFNDR